jgi:hypothetical protein
VYLDRSSAPRTGARRPARRHRAWPNDRTRTPSTAAIPRRRARRVHAARNAVSSERLSAAALLRRPAPVDQHLWAAARPVTRNAAVRRRCPCSRRGTAMTAAGWRRPAPRAGNQLGSDAHFGSHHAAKPWPTVVFPARSGHRLTLPERERSCLPQGDAGPSCDYVLRRSISATSSLRP